MDDLLMVIEREFNNLSKTIAQNLNPDVEHGLDGVRESFSAPDLRGSPLEQPGKNVHGHSSQNHDPGHRTFGCGLRIF